MSASDDNGPTKVHSSLPDDKQTIVAATGQLQPDPDARTQELPVGFRLDEFEVQAKLGEGGFSIVYRVWDHSLCCQRALKEYMPASVALRGAGSTVVARSEQYKEVFDAGLDRFIREARTLAGFDHPALVRVLRRWEANGTAYMLMPLYEGPTFKAYVREAGHTLSEAWLLGFLDALTQALDVVHRADWLHRDIAPDNIILVDDDRPVLIDFGAARQVIGGLTQDLTAILKPGYAPVEQYGDTPGMEQGPWTDVYALAATMYWAIVGRPPPSSVGRVLVDGYVPLAQCAAGRYSACILTALDRAMAVSPKERTQSMAQLRADLGLTQQATVGRTRATEAVDVASAAPATQSPRQRRGLWAAATGAGVLALMAAFLWLKQPPAPGAEGAIATSPSAPSAGAQGLEIERRKQDASLGSPSNDVSTTTGPTPPSASDLNPDPAGTAATSGTNPATVQPAASSVGFDVNDQIAQVISLQTPGFTVAATPTKLKLSVAAADQLQFDIVSSRAGYVTVLLVGPDGALVRLFSSPADKIIKIAAGQRLRLPPPAAKQLGAAPPLGSEVVMVIVSETPRDYGFIAKTRVGSFLELHTGAPASNTLTNWKEPHPLLLGTAKPCPSGSCNDYGAAAFTVEVVQ